MTARVPTTGEKIGSRGNSRIPRSYELGCGPWSRGGRAKRCSPNFQPPFQPHPSSSPSFRQLGRWHQYQHQLIVLSPSSNHQYKDCRQPVGSSTAILDQLRRHQVLRWCRGSLTSAATTVACGLSGLLINVPASERDSVPSENAQYIEGPRSWILTQCACAPNAKGTRPRPQSQLSKIDTSSVCCYKELKSLTDVTLKCGFASAWS